MIEPLTKGKLIEYEFSNNNIEDIFNREKCEMTFTINKGTFIVSTLENKIYSATDAFTKCYFKDETKPQFPYNDFDLVPKYFELLTANYIAERKKEAKITFNEKKAKEQLKQIEIEKVTALIEGFKRENNRATFHKRKIDKYNDYLVWLQSLDIEDFFEIKINPLTLIKEDVLNLFSAAENKATNNTTKFSNDIRCAAFCEYLFEKKYYNTNYKTKRQDRKIQKQFALSRYGRNIEKALHPSKKVERLKHINRKIDEQPALKSCF